MPILNKVLKHVFKLYNTKTENRTVVTVDESRDSQKAAIEIAIKQHAKVIKTNNKPSNWKVEHFQIVENQKQGNLQAKQPKAKSKLLMKSK
jgi:hypothetical protein